MGIEGVLKTVDSGIEKMENFDFATLDYSEEFSGFGLTGVNIDENDTVSGYIYGNTGYGNMESYLSPTDLNKYLLENKITIKEKDIDIKHNEKGEVISVHFDI